MMLPSRLFAPRRLLCFRRQFTTTSTSTPTTTEHAAHQDLATRYLEEYEDVRFWRIGKSLVSKSDVNLVVGLSTYREDVEIRLHAVERVPIILEAPLLSEADVLQLFAYYKNDGPNTNAAFAIAMMNAVQVSRQGIRLKMRSEEIEDQIIPHNDFMANMLPKHKAVDDAIRIFNRRLRNNAMETIHALHAESFGLDYNFIGSDHAEENRVWNEEDGPKGEARELQQRYNISNQELMDHFTGEIKRD